MHPNFYKAFGVTLLAGLIFIIMMKIGLVQPKHETLYASSIASTLTESTTNETSKARPK